MDQEKAPQGAFFMREGELALLSSAENAISTGSLM
jgi:hypothetical protein